MLSEQNFQIENVSKMYTYKNDRFIEFILISTFFFVATTLLRFWFLNFNLYLFISIITCLVFTKSNTFADIICIYSIFLLPFFQVVYVYFCLYVYVYILSLSFFILYWNLCVGSAVGYNFPWNKNKKNNKLTGKIISIICLSKQQWKNWRFV